MTVSYTHPHDQRFWARSLLALERGMLRNLDLRFVHLVLIERLTADVAL